MKESWEINSTKVQMTPSENKGTALKSRKPWKLLDFIFSIFLYIILILVLITTVLKLQRIHVNEKLPIRFQLSKDELKDILKSTVNNGDLINNKEQYNYNVQLLDENNNILWSDVLDANDLVNLNDFSPYFKSIESYDEDDDYTNSRSKIPSDVIRQTRTTHENFSFLLFRLVNCARFKPVGQGRYLVSPSLNALHTCYQFGFSLNDLDDELVPHNNRGSPRYDLENLYLKCEDVFTENIQVLTPELAEDYRRCRRAGAVDRDGANFIERRFAQTLVEHDQKTETTEISIPENLLSTTSRPKLDIRAFVHCSHVEYQTYDPPESPNEEALLRCERQGVTVEEIERGIASNPRSDQYKFDTSLLYIPCEEAFASGLNWITGELIGDYRRCKSLGLITEQTGRIIEDTFYEHIHGGAPPEESPVKSTTDYEASAESSATPVTPATPGGHAFANCRRIENKPYRICIKVIASYSGPTAYAV